jgi:hypothetical protein
MIFFADRIADTSRLYIASRNAFPCSLLTMIVSTNRLMVASR